MDIVHPPLPGIRGPWRPAIELRVSLVPAYFTSLQVHVPDRVVGGLDGKSEPFFAFPQRLLCILAIGYVDINAHHMPLIVRRILEHLPPARDPMDGSIRPDYAPFLFGRCSGLQGFIRSLHHPYSVIRID